jgi:hypothetical protein
MALTTSADWLYFLGLSGTLGITGQLIRTIGGAKKVNDQAAHLGASFSDVFEWPTFLTSMATGFAAGIIAGLSNQVEMITSQYVLSIIAAGYAGSDFITAFLKKSLPDEQKTSSVRATQAARMAALQHASPPQSAP